MMLANNYEVQAEESNIGNWEKLGVQRVAKLDTQICWRRHHYLERGLRKGWWDEDPELKKIAKSYSYWMQYLAQRGGNRAGKFKKK